MSASQPIGNETNTHKHMRCDIKYVKIKMQYKIVNFSGKLSNRARYDVCVCVCARIVEVHLSEQLLEVLEFVAPTKLKSLN